MTKYLKANFIKNTLLTACNDNKLRCYCGHEYTEDEVNSLDNKTLNKTGFFSFSTPYYFFGTHKECEKKYKFDIKHKHCEMCGELTLPINSERTICKKCEDKQKIANRTVICQACGKSFIKHSSKALSVYCNECKENGKAKIAEVKNQYKLNEILNKYIKLNDLSTIMFDIYFNKTKVDRKKNIICKRYF